MSRRKDEGDATPMLDLVASLASDPSEADFQAAEETSEGEQQVAGDPSESDGADEATGSAESDDPMAGLLADAGVAPEAAEAAASGFVDSDAEDGAVQELVPDTASTDEDTPAEAVSAEIDEHSDDIRKVDATASDEKASSKVAMQPKPQIANGSASERILLRQDVLDIAGELEAGRIGKRTAVRRIREVCEGDAEALDLDDIEVDFDATPEDRTGLSFLAGLGVAKPQPKEIDPVEAALLAAIKQRDRVSALSIVGDTPTPNDRAAYRASLLKLRDMLVAHLPD